MNESTPPPLPPPVESGAGFGIRALARIVDIIYGIVLGFFAGILAAIVLTILARAGLIELHWLERMKGTGILQFSLGLVGAFLYHSVTEGMYGASLGKLICQIRVIREDGQPMGMKQGFFGAWRTI